MSKRKWYTRAIYSIVALALCLGLTMVPATAGAVIGSSVTLEAEPDHCLCPLDVTLTATLTPDGMVAPYSYAFVVSNYAQQEGGPWMTLDDPDLLLLFGDADGDGSAELPEIDKKTTSDTTVKVNYTFTVPGVYEVEVTVTDAKEYSVGPVAKQVRTLGIIPPDIAYDVKGACQKICVKGMATNSTIEWWLEPGVDLTPADITDCEGNPWVAANETGPCIVIKSMKRGDIHVFARVTGDPCGEGEPVILHTEKKWGELHHSVLDLDADKAGIQGPSELVTVSPTRTEEITETIEDTVYATFKEVIGTRTVGDAIVHWWLFKDTEDNQALIDKLMDHLVAHGGGFDEPLDHWAAHGKYDTEVLADMIGAVGDKEPFDVIDFWAQTFHADPSIFGWSETLPDPLKPWYFQNETADSWPAEKRGKAQATLVVDPEGLTPCEVEKVMIVVLVSYPGSGDPKDDPYNGENIVIIEKGKKQFHKTKVAEVKTPQIRWAGEKIVLEKDWSDMIDPGKHYVVAYNLEYGDRATLHPVDGVSFSEGLVYAFLDNGVSQCILESEKAGEADVDAALYEVPEMELFWGGLVAEIGFVVYFLEFEDVTLAEDITPAASLRDLRPGIDEADVAVQVRGFFDYRHSHLMETAREEKPLDLDGDGVADVKLPAGRYVLPDDWWLLAGTKDVSLRPNFDLMDQANLDAITSAAELGPYDSGVVTAGPLAKAEEPCIGPFNTLQPWSIEDKWIASATVPSSIGVRNTVVPDGKIDAFDCPMPQALVIFDIVGYSTIDEIPALSGLDKGDLEGYGYVGTPKVYQSPFYAVEIPAHWVIPGGYNWDSWGIGARSGPYDYWTDLGLDSIIADTREVPIDSSDVEVYCDNHGIAGVTINALNQVGSVTITATAEFPYSPKRGKYGPRVSDEITAQWGARELNPHFVADKTAVDVGELVTFTNLTTGGTIPYTKAEWDFDADGIIETTVVGTHAQVMASVQCAYASEGVYTVRLWVTDSTPTTRYEERPFYINVGGVVPTITWNLPYGLDADPAAVNIWSYPAAGVTVTLADVEDSMPDGLLIWHYGGPGVGWKFYKKGWGAYNTLTSLVPGEGYMGIVPTAGVWNIPQA